MSVQSINTGISGVDAYKSGNVVMLIGFKGSGWSVNAGHYIILGTLPQILRPSGIIVFGVATDGYTGGRHNCDVQANAINGELALESSFNINVYYFSITYITK